MSDKMTALLTALIILLTGGYVLYLHTESENPNYNYTSRIVATQMAQQAWRQLQVSNYNLCSVQAAYRSADAQHQPDWSKKLDAAKADLAATTKMWESLRNQALSLDSELSESDLQTTKQVVCNSY